MDTSMKCFSLIYEYIIIFAIFLQYPICLNWILKKSRLIYWAVELYHLETAGYDAGSTTVSADVWMQIIGKTIVKP